MKPEAVATPSLDCRSDADRLALTLLAIAADQNVRMLEALAACLMNRAQQAQGDDTLPPLECVAASPDPASASDLRRKLQVSRRIARRALCGSLADPTQGATACHRIDATPSWSRGLLPVAIVGGFLFYRLPAGGRTVDVNAAGETVRPGR